MIRSIEKEGCCGCSACEYVCPVCAIHMEPDALGYLFPILNEGVCIKCNLCSKVCPFENVVTHSEKQSVYSARHHNNYEVESSRSGAVFVALSDVILKNGGVVYGAGYGDYFRVEHKRALSREGCHEFKGSKYSQSDLRGIYSQLRQDLMRGVPVLFSGTPCQCEAIRRVTQKHNQSNLLLVDIVCHGVSSPAIWNEFLHWVERESKSKILSVDFRDKSIFGWDGLHKESYLLETGKKYLAKYTYYSDLHMRESCCVCQYSSLNRPSDITIGDLWGWEKVCPDMNSDKKGCSLVIVNSEKGRRLFQVSSGDLIVKEIDLSQCMQPNLVHPTKRNPKSREFYEDYKNKGFKYIIRKYYPSRMEILYHRVFDFMKRVINR